MTNVPEPMRLISPDERLAASLGDISVSLRACASSLRRIDLTLRGEPIPSWLMSLDEVQEQIDKVLAEAEQ